MDLGSALVWGDVVRAHAASRGDKPALVDANGVVTFGAINRRMNQLNHALATLGLRKGDRVAILSRNRREFLEVVGVAKSGLVSVPLNWRLTARELLHPLQDCRPVALVVEPGYIDLIDGLRTEAGSIAHFIVFGEAREGWLGYEDLLRDASDAEPNVEVDPADPASIIYSSGTTGNPKGCVLSHRGVLNNCRAARDDMLGLTPDDVGLAVMPLFHSGGLWYYLFPSFASGGTTVLLAEFNAGAVLQAIRRHGVTHLHIVPTMISALLDEPGIEQAALSCLRVIKYAASSIPLSVLKRAQQVFRHCGLVQSFGSTEGGIVTALTPADHANAAGGSAAESLLLSCGRPCGDVHVEVRDFSGSPAAPGVVGDIVIRSDRVMLNYWENPQATNQAVVDGWLYTGDLGYLDGDGYLYIVDRKNDMIVTGGENVYPREVEDILYENPDIAEAAVFAIPDPKWVERVAAAVVLKPGRDTTIEEIRRRAGERLASYKCPKSVFFVDRLPKNAAGKVLKKELRRQYGQLRPAA
jgi:long-chain acyl-CoA synthetase